MNMNRRGFLRGIIGTGVAAIAAPALRLEPFLAKRATGFDLAAFDFAVKKIYRDVNVLELSYAANPLLAMLPKDGPLFSEPPSVGQERNPPRETALAAGSSPARFTQFVLRAGLAGPVEERPCL